MRWSAIFPLVWDNLRRNRFFGLAAIFGVAVGVALMTAVVGLGAGITQHVVHDVFQTLPDTQLRVTASRMDLGFLNFAKPKFLKGSRLGDDLVETIETQPGVAAAYGEMVIRFPIKVTGSFMGHHASTDLVGNGLKAEVIAPDLDDPTTFAYRQDGPVPAVVSTQLLELYNSTFAPMNDFPALSADALKGFRFDLVLGQSYLGGRAQKGRVRRVQCELVGFSDKAINIGFTVPIDYVKAWNAEFADDAQDYRAIIVTVTDPARVNSLKLWLEDKGYVVATAKEGAGEKVAQAIGFLTTLVSGVALTILLLTALNLAFLLFVMVKRRRAEIGLWRSLGATRTEISATILLEALILGAFGALLGLLAGVLAAGVLESLIVSRLAGLPFAPSRLIAWPWWLWIVAPLCALAFCLLGALVPAIGAGRQSPAQAMKPEG